MPLRDAVRLRMSGGPGTRDGPAWVGVADGSASPVERETRTSPRPRDRLQRRRGPGRSFTPLSALPAACRPWGCSSPGSSTSPSLGRRRACIREGWRLSRPPTLDHLAPAPLNSAQPPSLPEDGGILPQQSGCGITSRQIQRRFPPAPCVHAESFFQGATKIGGVWAVLCAEGSFPLYESAPPGGLRNETIADQKTSP